MMLMMTMLCTGDNGDVGDDDGDDAGYDNDAGDDDDANYDVDDDMVSAGVGPPAFSRGRHP